MATPPTAEPELCVAPAMPAVPAAGLGGSSAAGPLSRPGLGLTATPDRLRDLLQGLAAMERPGVVVLRCGVWHCPRGPVNGAVPPC